MGFRVRSVVEVFVAALRLGFTSFGGPVAHISYFHREYVGRRAWIDDARFSELVAVAQILPGPSSSQLGIAIGHLRAGVPGAIAAWVGFTLPSAILMVLLALLWGSWAPSTLALATHGLMVVAAATILQAVLQLYQKQCPTTLLAAVAWVAFTALLVIPGTWTLAVLLGVGLAAGAGSARSDIGIQAPTLGFGRTGGIIALGLFGLLAVGLPVLRGAFPGEAWAWADAFYRTGSWVFGGGHVVLPWLQNEVVAPGWVSLPTFLAGYGAAQALPGPLFTVAAFLGMVMGGLPGAIVALVAIFLPGFLLIEGVLPFWSRLRNNRRWTGAFAGACAVVVGLLGSTLVTSVGPTVARPTDLALAIGFFLLLERGKWPAWAVALLGVLVGIASLLLGSAL